MAPKEPESAIYGGAFESGLDRIPGTDPVIDADHHLSLKHGRGGDTV